LPSILSGWGNDPPRAAGRVSAALCCCGLPLGLGLFALLKKDRPRSRRMGDQQSQGEAPPRKPFPVALLILGLVVGVPLLTCAGFAFVGVLVSPMPRGTPTIAVESNGAIIKSKDGTFQMQVPAGWSPATDLDARNQLEVRSPGRDITLSVVTMLKTDFRKAMTYRELTELTTDALLKGSGEARVVQGPTDLVVNTRPALQYEIHRQDKYTRVADLLTTIDGRGRFYQVLVTTTPSGVERNRTTLQEILDSFTEIK
jgi:hypothetical protein